MAAALVHDWNFLIHVKTFEETNDLFHSMLIANNVTRAKAAMMYTAVSTAGKFLWDNDEAELAYLYSLSVELKAFDSMIYLPKYGLKEI